LTFRIKALNRRIRKRRNRSSCAAVKGRKTGHRLRFRPLRMTGAPRFQRLHDAIDQIPQPGPRLLPARRHPARDPAAVPPLEEVLEIAVDHLLGLVAEDLRILPAKGESAQVDRLDRRGVHRVGWLPPKSE